MNKIKPSVLEQLESIRKNFEELENYEMDVSANYDLTDAIYYSKMKDSIADKISEIQTNTQEVNKIA